MKTIEKQYERKVNELLEKYSKIMIHHIEGNFLRFANEIYKLNSEFFEIKEKEQEKWKLTILFPQEIKEHLPTIKSTF